jgi:hypothetical protein
MYKNKIKKKVKKQGKNKKQGKDKKQVKDKNVNISINIDQSKKTTGSNPKKSNIKTLPAFSSVPSSGGNYVRQFGQDPYYAQSQYDNMNMLRQYNQMINQNNPQLGYGFQNRNMNDQLLLRDRDRGNRLNEGQESVMESVVDNALYDDPRTGGDSQNAINQFQLPTGQMLPIIQEEEEKEEPKQIEGKIVDPIKKLMYSDNEYDDKGFKIFRESDIRANLYFNKKSGKWVKPTNAILSQMREEDNLESLFTRDPYSINMMFRDPSTDLKRPGHGWYEFIRKEPKPVEQPKQRGRKKKK